MDRELSPTNVFVAVLAAILVALVLVMAWRATSGPPAPDCAMAPNDAAFVACMDATVR